jgi:hypothetical protein
MGPGVPSVVPGRVDPVATFGISTRRPEDSRGGSSGSAHSSARPRSPPRVDPEVESSHGGRPTSRARRPWTGGDGEVPPAGRVAARRHRPGVDTPTRTTGVRSTGFPLLSHYDPVSASRSGVPDHGSGFRSFDASPGSVGHQKVNPLRGRKSSLRGVLVPRPPLRQADSPSEEMRPRRRCSSWNSVSPRKKVKMRSTPIPATALDFDSHARRSHARVASRSWSPA